MEDERIQGQRWSAAATRTPLGSEGSIGSAAPLTCNPSFVTTRSCSHCRQPPAREPCLQGPKGCGAWLDGVSDDVISRRSSNFGTATLTRAVNLAGLAPACQKAVREQQNRACLGDMRRPDLSARGGRWHPDPDDARRVRRRFSSGPMWSATATLAPWSTILVAADRPAASAVVSWPSSGFNSWEGQSHHRPWDRIPMSERPGGWLWGIGMPTPVFRLGSDTVGVFPLCHVDTQARNPASLYTCLADW